MGEENVSLGGLYQKKEAPTFKKALSRKKMVHVSQFVLSRKSLPNHPSKMGESQVLDLIQRDVLNVYILRFTHQLLCLKHGLGKAGSDQVYFVRSNHSNPTNKYQSLLRN